MDATIIFEKYKHTTIEINFKKGTDSHPKYGKTIGGVITIPDNGGNEFVHITAPSLVESTNGLKQVEVTTPILHKLGLIVNSACQKIYGISDEDVKLLKEDGFSILDIETDGIKDLSKKN